MINGHAARQCISSHPRGSVAPRSAVPRAVVADGGTTLRAKAAGAPGSVPRMVRPLGLPFDPIERAGETWERRFGPASAMRAATSVFRVQQILLARFDEVLKPHELTFARYEVLVLLTFSRSGELPLKVIGSRLMVHPTSVTNAIDRLVAAGYVRRRPNPDDGRGVLAGITDAGRAVVETATTALTDLDFGLGDLSEGERSSLFDTLRRVRLGAGDVQAAEVDGR
jgi:DNA-binding MarR family transcriptional regulator